MDSEERDSEKRLMVPKRRSMPEKIRRDGERIFRQQQSALRAWETFFYEEEVEDDSSDSIDDKPYHKEIINGYVTYRQAISKK